MKSKNTRTLAGMINVPFVCFLWATFTAPVLSENRVNMSKDDPSYRKYGSTSGRFNMEIWTSADGLPQNTVTDIVQTRDGYLWLGTFAGLVRFDGVRFKVFDLANTDGIASNRVTALCEADDGTLWFGTEEGTLTSYRDGQFTSFEPAERGVLGVVNDLVTDGTGGMWLSTMHGVLHFSNGKFRKIQIKDIDDGLDFNTESMHIDSTGKLWVGTGHGLAVYENGGLQLRFPGPGVRTINEDREGRLWFNVGHDIGELHHGQLTRHKASPDGQVKKVHIGSVTNRIWIGSSEGLYIFGSNRSIAEDFRWSQDLRSKLISFRAIFEDREGNVWVGTNSGGLVRFNDRRVHRLIPKLNNFRTGSGMNALAIDADGAILVAADCGGIRRLCDDTYEPFPDYEKFPVKGCVRAMTNDSHGTLWIEHKGRISRRRDGQWNHYYTAEGLPGGPLDELLAARDGSFWAGGLALYRFEDGQFDMIPGTENTVERIRSIYDSADGTIWFGGWKGVGRYENGRVTIYTHTDGLGQGQVRAIYEDEQGVMWFGSYGGGITRLKDGRFARITVNDGLFDNTVSKILPDDNGNLWINSNRGIFAASLDELNAVADGRLSEMNCASVNSGEGNGADGLRTTDGRMWFPTIEGVAVINPENFVRNTIPPNVTVESIKADGVLIDTQSELRIPPGNRDLEIRYTGLSFTEPEKVQFRYFLEGYNDDWVEAGTRRVAYFTNVPHGKFKFHVIACNNDGIWNETGASVTMSLSPYFHETNWFAAMCFVFVIGTIGVAYKLRTHNIRARNERLQEEIKERKLVEDALRGSEARYRTFVDHAIDALFIHDDGGCIIDVNRQACESLGYPRNELIGKAPFEFNTDITTAFAENIEKRLAAGELVAFDSRHRRKDGAVFPVSIRIRPFTMNGRQLRLTLARDITEQKEAEDGMRQHQVALTHAQRLSSVGEMVASLSHELHQPLGAIRNYVSVLQDLVHRERENGVIGAATNGLIEESERACEIMNRLRNFTRRRELRRSTVDINDVIQDAVRLTSAEAQQLGITVMVHLDKPIAKILADSVQIKQVAVNLITNALDSMTDTAPERRRVDVHTRHLIEQCRVRVTVSDNGTGIPVQLRGSVFDSFFTTKKEGLGLGLAISRSIIEAHGGKLSLDDNPHGGMIFGFELPYDISAKE
ncbi:MAG: PAS domain S-box protein [Phycisphaerales bacterium]|nr:PAS domain S-box protein [Phycisphaerales bacterium]